MLAFMKALSFSAILLSLSLLLTACGSPPESSRQGPAAVDRYKDLSEADRKLIGYWELVSELSERDHKAGVPSRLKFELSDEGILKMDYCDLAGTRGRTRYTYEEGALSFQVYLPRPQDRKLLPVIYSPTITSIEKDSFKFIDKFEYRRFQPKQALAFNDQSAPLCLTPPGRPPELASIPQPVPASPEPVTEETKSAAIDSEPTTSEDTGEALEASEAEIEP